jgi:hypothetical protein
MTHIGIGLGSAAIAAVVLEIAWRLLSARESSFRGTFRKAL